MKLTLNESSRKFIDTLDEADRAKLIFTEDTVESDDAGIHEKFRSHIKARLDAVGAKVRSATEQFKAEHPEYFD